MTAKNHIFGRKVWFKNKRFGWGFAPSTWRGWLFVAVCLTVLITYVVSIDDYSRPIAETLLASLPFVVIMSVVLVMVSYRRGERSRLVLRRKSKRTQKNHRQ